VPQLDGPLHAQRPLATAGARRPVEGGGDVGHQRRVKVARDVHPGQVIARVVGPGDKVRARAHRAVGDDRHLWRQTHRAGVAWHRARRRDLVVGRRAQRPAAQRAQQLGLIDLQIAANHGEDEAPRHRGALLHEEDRLERLAGRHAQEVGHRLDRGAVRRGDLLHWLERSRRQRGQRKLGGFQIGRVTASVAAREGVLARLVDEHELVAEAPAHRPRIRLDRQSGHADALEDARVGGDHARVEAIQAGGVGVQRIGVFHGELAQADQPAPRAWLVAILRLNLVEVLGKLLVAVNLARGQRSDHFLVRWPQDVLPPGLRREFLQGRPKRLPATGRLP